MTLPNNRRRLLFKIALALFSLSLTLAFAECVDRIFVPATSDTLIIPIESINERFHHRFKERPIPSPLPGAVRIAFIGDSFTRGIGVKDPDTKAFPALVGRFFGEGSVKGDGRPEVQTFNLGAPSYSPSIYGVVLREFTPKLNPHIVVLGLDDSDPHDDLISTMTSPRASGRYRNMKEFITTRMHTLRRGEMNSSPVS